MQDSSPLGDVWPPPIRSAPLMVAMDEVARAVALVALVALVTSATAASS